MFNQSIENGSCKKYGYRHPSIYRETTQKMEKNDVCGNDTLCKGRIVCIAVMFAVIFSVICAFKVGRVVESEEWMSSGILRIFRGQENIGKKHVFNRIVTEVSNIDDDTTGLLQPNGSILWQHSGEGSDRINEMQGSLLTFPRSDDGDNDVLVSSKCNSLHSHKMFEIIMGIYLIRNGGITFTEAISFLLYYSVVLIPGVLGADVLYMDPAPVTDTNTYYPCLIQNFDITTDFKYWTYLGNDTCLSRWNSLACSNDHIQISSLLQCNTVLSNPTQICTGGTLALCTSLVLALRDFFRNCKNMNPYFTSLPGWMSKVPAPTIPPSVGDIAWGQTFMKNLSMSSDGTCTFTYSALGYNANILSPDLKVLTTSILSLRKNATLDINNSNWIPGKPLQCFKNQTVRIMNTDYYGVKLLNLNENQCPNNISVPSCTGECYTVRRNVTKFDVVTSLGSCCTSTSTDLYLQKVLDICATDPVKIMKMDPRTCGSKQYYIYPCNTNCTKDPFLSWKSAGIDSITDQPFMLTVDCDKAKSMVLPYTSTSITNHRDSCNCISDELCFKENGLTKKLGVDYATATDRVEVMKCIKILVRSYSDLHTRNSESVDNFYLSEFGVRQRLNREMFDNSCLMVLVVGDPKIISTSGSDLTIQQVGRSGAASPLLSERDDAPIITTSGAVFIDNCLAKMAGSDYNAYNDRINCVRGLVDENRTYKVKLATYATIILVIGQLLYWMVLYLSLSPGKSSTMFLMSIFRLWQMAFCTDDTYVDNKNVVPQFKTSKKDMNMKVQMLAYIMVLDETCYENSKVVWLTIKTTIFFPFSLILTLPLSLALGSMLFLASIPSYLRGNNRCDGKWCYITATSLVDLFSKFMFLFMLHCYRENKKSKMYFSKKAASTSCVILCMCVMMYYYLVDFVVVPFASAHNGVTTGGSLMMLYFLWKFPGLIIFLLPIVNGASIGHTLNLAGKCDGVVCRGIINIDVLLKISSGNFVDFPLSDDTGALIGKITLVHTGMTRQFLGVYKSSIPSFNQKLYRAVCKSTDGNPYKDMRSCVKYWEAGPLDKNEACGGDNGGNYRMGEDWDYLKKPTYCNFWTPKGFSWGWSIADDGHEFLGVQYTMSDTEPIIRYYTMSEGILTGNVLVKIEIHGEIVFSETVDATALFDTTTFQQFGLQVTLREEYGASKSLGGEIVACFFENAASINPSTCVIHSTDFNNLAILQTYGEPNYDLDCGISDYTSWQLNRGGLGTYGSNIQNEMTTKPALQNLLRDSKSIVSYTSCSIETPGFTGFSVEKITKCSHRTYTDEKSCSEDGNWWRTFNTCIPKELKLTLKDCSIASVGVKISAELTYGIGAGMTKIIPPNSISVTTNGCFGISNQLVVRLKSEGNEDGIAMLDQGTGVDCPAIAYIRGGSGTMNCTAHYSANASLTFSGTDKQKKIIPLSTIEKCKSYTFNDGTIGSSQSSGVAEKTDLLTWIIAITILALVVILLIVLLCCCARFMFIKNVSQTEVSFSKMDSPHADNRLQSAYDGLKRRKRLQEEVS